MKKIGGFIKSHSVNHQKQFVSHHWGARWTPLLTLKSGGWRQEKHSGTELCLPFYLPFLAPIQEYRCWKCSSVNIPNSISEVISEVPQLWHGNLPRQAQAEDPQPWHCPLLRQAQAEDPQPWHCPYPGKHSLRTPQLWYLILPRQACENREILSSFQYEESQISTGR